MKLARNWLHFCVIFAKIDRDLIQFGANSTKLAQNWIADLIHVDVIYLNLEPIAIQFHETGSKLDPCTTQFREIGTRT